MEIRPSDDMFYVREREMYEIKDFNCRRRKGDSRSD